MSFVFTAVSTKGRHHETNEDTYSIGDHYVVVADGMGGETGGEVASKLAVTAISHVLDSHNLRKLNENSAKELMFSAIGKADSLITEHIEEHPDLYGMGTTILLLVHDDNQVYLAWCGDSRCYLHHQGKIQSLTRDHSYVQELIDDEKLTVEESFAHPDNNIVTRFVGGGEMLCVPEFVSMKLSASDILILCSDGLSGYCHSEDINKRILMAENMESAPESLRDLALAHGSDDDITIVLMQQKESKRSFWRRFYRAIS